MPDPFEALRSTPEPVAPDAEFAARLRARVERAMTLPEGVDVSETTLPSRPAATDGSLARGPEPDAAPATVTPYLIVSDARRAIDWYVEVLGARRRGEPMVMADGRVGHAEIDLGSSTLFLADESPDSRGRRTPARCRGDGEPRGRSTRRRRRAARTSGAGAGGGAGCG